MRVCTCTEKTFLTNRFYYSLPSTHTNTQIHILSRTQTPHTHVVYSALSCTHLYARKLQRAHPNTRRQTDTSRCASVHQALNEEAKLDTSCGVNRAWMSHHTLTLTLTLASTVNVARTTRHTPRKPACARADTSAAMINISSRLIDSGAQ